MTDAMAPSTTAVLQARGLSKSFPGVRALDRADLTCRPGRVHALVGENGAGKSTLVRILTGNQLPDEGELLLDGKPVRFDSPGRPWRPASRRCTRSSPSCRP
ncbi:ATP-binding cassette domain-containing protein [Blastococcus sp. PRF04-17]|uniref:ATP-binding cassette domain-containing protein n=1 Tax=Blastococcus sp. PRF04-17 TaxID=2933797 RepID=UPI0021131A45|nr:ATP-binding cassette domain-containing protein [Blastococcus sp. PRF04-17]